MFEALVMCIQRRSSNLRFLREREKGFRRHTLGLSPPPLPLFIVPPQLELGNNLEKCLPHKPSIFLIVKILEEGRRSRRLIESLLGDNINYNFRDLFANSIAITIYLCRRGILLWS
ncbi:hypothetical protein P8452_21314 [Trifolium repens]|nr:hypothetical protein P8452_21314 [Trifolium repens]